MHNMVNYLKAFTVPHSVPSHGCLCTHGVLGLLHALQVTAFPLYYILLQYVTKNRLFDILYIVKLQKCIDNRISLVCTGGSRQRFSPRNSYLTRLAPCNTCCRQGELLFVFASVPFIVEQIGLCPSVSQITKNNPNCQFQTLRCVEQKTNLQYCSVS